MSKRCSLTVVNSLACLFLMWRCCGVLKLDAVDLKKSVFRSDTVPECSLRIAWDESVFIISLSNFSRFTSSVNGLQPIRNTWFFLLWMELPLPWSALSSCYREWMDGCTVGKKMDFCITCCIPIDSFAQNIQMYTICTVVITFVITVDTTC